MSVVTRYFSTASAGANDGTSWADRAQLVSGSTWSTVITGFNFAGSDSLVCLIGPGTHTTGAAMASGLFANAPTVANPIVFQGCDSSGNPLIPPNPDWLSCEPNWDDNGLPIITTTTDVVTTSLATAVWRLVSFTASGRNGAMITSGAAFDWCSLTNTTSNSSATTINASVQRVQNCLVMMTGSSYSAALTISNSCLFDNNRILGVTGSSGNRNGLVDGTSGTLAITRTTIVRHGGSGITSSSSSTAQHMLIANCVVANNGSNGILFASTASQTSIHQVRNCMLTGNGAYGLDCSAANVLSLCNRTRDNTSGGITGLANWPADLGPYTTDTDDASEYVDAGNATTALQDYTIKSSAAIAGMGFGVAEQAAASSAVEPFHFALG